LNGERRDRAYRAFEERVMATLDISLPDDMMAFVEEQAAREGFRTAGEYLCSVIRDVQKRQAKQALEAKLREALESGPPEPMTREDWDDLERKALQRLDRERRRP
jgi:antitoxin ParD1/3/4